MNIETIHGTTKYVPQSAQQVLTVFGSTVQLPSASINEYTVMSLPAFWRAIRFLSSALAGLPRGVMQEQGVARVKAKHYLNRILKRRVNDTCTPFVFWETIYHHATVWGNGYAWIRRNPATFEVEQLVNLNPEIITPFLYQGQKWFFVRAEKPFVLPYEDVLHIHVMGFNALCGYPLVTLLQQSLETGKYAEGHTANYFKKGTVLRGAIQVPGNLDDAQLKTMQDSLQAYKGVDAERDWMILQANATLNNTTVPNETSQLIETRKFSIADIARIVDVPPHILYEMGDAKWANVEQMGLEVVKYSLASWINKSEEELTLKLLTDAEADDGYYIHYNVDGLLKGDTASRTTNVVTLVNNGLATPNWGAAVLDLPPLGPEGDKLRVPVAVSQPIASAGTAAAVSKSQHSADYAAQLAATLAANEALQIAPVSQSQEDAETAERMYATVLDPMIDAVAERIDAKTEAAFAKRETLTPEELTPWANVFAEQQRASVLNAFRPVAAAAQALGKEIDCSRIAERYAAAVKRQAATKDKGSLTEIAKGIIYE